MADKKQQIEVVKCYYWIVLVDFSSKIATNKKNGQNGNLRINEKRIGF